MSELKTHHVNEINAKRDEIAESHLYIFIAYLSGKLPKEEAVFACHTYEEDFDRTLKLALEVGMMYYENDKTIRDILNGAE